MTWPDSTTGDLLGDHRYASATDRPETVESLCETVTRRIAEGHAVYPQGGRTALNYGGTPRAPGVAIDTRALDRVIDYPAGDMTITVEAGLTLGRLRAILAERHERLLVDAPQADQATLGGIYSTNTTGPRRFGAGRPRDQIIGVSFVTSDGALVKGGGRVVKNVAGYDLPKLLTGSLGTLGVLTQMTLKVRPIPEATALVWATYADPRSLADALERLNTSQTRPMAVEVLNVRGAEQIGVPLGLPVDAWVLAVGIEDNAPAVTWQLERLPLELEREVAVRRDAEAASLWDALIEFQVAEIGQLSAVANVRPSSVMAFCATLDADLCAVQAHAGNGIVRLHAVGSQELDALAKAIEQLRKLAAADGGSVIVSRCPAEWKGRLRVWGDPRPDWAIAERVKNALDPKGVMNPGRFVGTI